MSKDVPDVQCSLKIRILHVGVFRWTKPNGGQTHSQAKQGRSLRPIQNPPESAARALARSQPSAPSRRDPRQPAPGSPKPNQKAGWAKSKDCRSALAGAEDKLTQLHRYGMRCSQRPSCTLRPAPLMLALRAGARQTYAGLSTPSLPGSCGCNPKSWPVM